MALTRGTLLGPYEVREPLGAGGMGEVFRAHDTKLGRDVALKVLPAAFAASPERRARFEREARTLAALNHPHIAQLSQVAVSPGEPPNFGAATVTVGRWRRDRNVRGYDIAPDGSMIITPQPTYQPPGIVLNFDVLVERKLAEATTDEARGQR